MKTTLLISMAIIIMFVAMSNGYTSQKKEIKAAELPTKKVPELYYKNITPLDAKNILAANKKAILLDVRTPEEYTETHIPGSILLPLDQITQQAATVLKDKDAKIIIYCRSGRRSLIAAKELLALGYKNIYNLGGINDWPYEVEKGNPK